VIEERRDRIQRDLAAAERLKGETDKALQTYEKALSDARGSASAATSASRRRSTRTRCTASSSSAGPTSGWKRSCAP